MKWEPLDINTNRWQEDDDFCYPFSVINSHSKKGIYVLSLYWGIDTFVYQCAFLQSKKENLQLLPLYNSSFYSKAFRISIAWEEFLSKIGLQLHSIFCECNKGNKHQRLYKIKQASKVKKPFLSKVHPITSCNDINITKNMYITITYSIGLSEY